MSAEFFIDTNILAYTFDRRDHAKRVRATELVRGALNGNGCISWQVVQEFCNIAQRRFVSPLTDDELRSYQTKVLFPLCSVWPDADLYREAMTVKMETGYGWYDSLIVSAAIRAEVRVLYTEDLQDGRKYRSLKIVDPFLD
jgi:predicted nucleic acid-binding protein